MVNTLVLQAVGGRCVSQLSIQFFLLSRHPLCSVRSPEKGTSMLLLRYPDSFFEFKHLNMINCSAPLVRVEIYQCLVYLLFNMPEKVRVVGLYHTGREELHKIPALKTISSIF